MANETYISFLKENDNSYQKPDKEVKRLEKSDFIGKTVDDSYIAGLYDKLEEEILQRGGYQSIVQFSPDEENHLNTNQKKARVEYFNEAMITRPYIASGGLGQSAPSKEE